MSPADVVQAQLDAYNAHDVEALCRYFTAGIEVANLHEAPNLTGIEGFRERHIGLFAQFPQNRANLVSRIVVGDKVLDHERVFRSPEATPFEVVAIYSFEGGLIARIDFIR
jgi:hypothetical protein